MSKHGMYYSKEYASYRNMINRCFNPDPIQKKSYQSRTICKEWLGPDGFKNFYNHIGPCPSKKHSLDRIDNNKDYEVGNVRWATAKEQARNRRNNRFITFNGKTKCISEWAEIYKIDRRVLRNRIFHYGWDIETALTKPPMERKIYYR